ncbi:unnamed protein product [Protopolystoma xenopodis]|uniref:Uncharacterized protein n=1 Tax=Protopolystoma xenopodis TaxID=117903 RepID=A0A3S5CK12_9PLAT|nr:unnamed protein product [Protopolystoma xenopodis]
MGISGNHIPGATDYRKPPSRLAAISTNGRNSEGPGTTGQHPSLLPPTGSQCKNSNRPPKSASSSAPSSKNRSAAQSASSRHSTDRLVESAVNGSDKDIAENGCSGVAECSDTFLVGRTSVNHSMQKFHPPRQHILEPLSREDLSESHYDQPTLLNPANKRQLVETEMGQQGLQQHIKWKNTQSLSHGQREQQNPQQLAFGSKGHYADGRTERTAESLKPTVSADEVARFYLLF